MIINGPKPYLIHIVAIVDLDQVVYKYYGRHKQWWHYEIEQVDLLQVRIDRTKKFMAQSAHTRIEE